MPILAALPVFEGPAQAGTLALFTAYVEHHAWLPHALVLPERAARGFGQLILWLRILLQIIGGIGAARFLRALGFGPIAGIGGILYELGPGFAPWSGLDTGWSVAGGAAALPLVLAAGEICIVPVRSGLSAAVALGSAITVLGLLADLAGFDAGLCFALVWALARLATIPRVVPAAPPVASAPRSAVPVAATPPGSPDPRIAAGAGATSGRRLRTAAACRLLAGTLLGLLLTFPGQALALASADPWSLLQGGPAPGQGANALSVAARNAVSLLSVLAAHLPSLGVAAGMVAGANLPGSLAFAVVALPVLACALMAGLKRADGSLLRATALVAIAAAAVATSAGWWRHAQPVASLAAVLLAAAAMRDTLPGRDQGAGGGRYDRLRRPALLFLAAAVAVAAWNAGVARWPLALGSLVCAALCLAAAKTRLLPTTLAISTAALFEALLLGA